MGNKPRKDVSAEKRLHLSVAACEGVSRWRLNVERSRFFSLWDEDHRG